MPKVNKDLRSFPNAFGLSFGYFVAYILTIGGGIIIFLINATLLKIVLFLMVVIGFYYLFWQLSRNSLHSIITIGEDITGEVDTIEAL